MEPLKVIIRNKYRQNSNISHILVVGYKLLITEMQLNHRCSNNIFILDLTPGFNGPDNGNCKRDEKTSFRFWDLRLICLLY